jgi:hypothetical protein
VDGPMAEHIQWRCAPYTVASFPLGSLVPGTIVTLPAPGTGVAAGRFEVDCPAGQVARGQVLRIGSYTDAYHLICGTLSVAEP